MMISWGLFLFSVGLLVLGLLNLVAAPAWSPWQAAVLAGEFGHWLAPLGLALAVVAASLRAAGPLLSVAMAGASLAATALLLKPAFQAWRLAAQLPSKLTAEFGPRAEGGERFSFARLYVGRDPAPVAMREFALPGGLSLDFYPAAAPVEGAAPCVIMVHGGGWNGGDRRQIAALNHWIARRGYAVAAISYRLAPEFRWPAQRDDLHAAVNHLREHAGRYRIDPNRLVVIGRSAGGQIALATVYEASVPGVRGVVALYAPSDLIFGYVNTHENDMLKSPALMRQFLGGTPESARANYESASALLQVSPQTPPTLLLHGANDALVWHRHSVRLNDRLAELRVPHLFVSLPWATHAFEYNLQGPGGQLTTLALAWFLESVTRRASPAIHAR